MVWRSPKLGQTHNTPYLDNINLEVHAYIYYMYMYLIMWEEEFMIVIAL